MASAYHAPCGRHMFSEAGDRQAKICGRPLCAMTPPSGPTSVQSAFREGLHQPRRPDPRPMVEDGVLRGMLAGAHDVGAAQAGGRIDRRCPVDLRYIEECK